MYPVCISGQLLMIILGAMRGRTLNININSKHINLQAVTHSWRKITQQASNIYYELGEQHWSKRHIHHFEAR